MNKLDCFREARFQALTCGDPCYLRGYPCVERVANPSEVGPVVYISGRPYRIAVILRRGLDEFQDGGVFYCYGYPIGPYRDRTPGCYLRKKREGQRDPTMTHVDDPHVFAVGHYIRREHGSHRIVGIRETPYRDTRFAYCQEVAEYDIPKGATIHDVRASDEEAHAQNIWCFYSPVITFRSPKRVGVARQHRDTMMGRKIRGAIRRDFMRRPH